MFAQRRADFRRDAAQALGHDLAPHALWSTGAIPAIRNPDLYQHLVRAQCPLWQAALHNGTADSPLDNTDGHYEPVLTHIVRHTPTTITAMSQAFATHITPLGSARGTRVKAWRSWLGALTWGLARNTLNQILPMSAETLQAMLWDFTTMGASKATLKAVVDSVLARHREARLPSPITGPLGYSRLARCLGRLLGSQHPHKMPVTRDMVVHLLRQQPDDLLGLRNKLVTITLTIGCMRPGEAADQTACDLVPDSDYQKGLLEYKDCSTLFTNFRKNDQERKGHQMRFGKATDPSLDLNYQLGLFMDIAGTRPSKQCRRQSLRGKRCPDCLPLFPKLVKGPNGSWVVAPNPRPSAAMVSGMVVSALRGIGLDTTAFSGVSCRMGGLTTAIEAGVPEHILWMQSGHAQDRAARRYVRLTHPDRLYDTWRAFRL